MGFRENLKLQLSFLDMQRDNNIIKEEKLVSEVRELAKHLEEFADRLERGGE
jgi:hypothetical protein